MSFMLAVADEYSGAFLTHVRSRSASWSWITRRRARRTWRRGSTASCPSWSTCGKLRRRTKGGAMNRDRPAAFLSSSISELREERGAVKGTLDGMHIEAWVWEE